MQFINLQFLTTACEHWYTHFLSLPISYLTIERKCSKFELVVQSIYCFFFNLFDKNQTNTYIVTRKLKSFRCGYYLGVTMQYKLTLTCPIKRYCNKTKKINVKN